MNMTPEAAWESYFLTGWGRHLPFAAAPLFGQICAGYSEFTVGFLSQPCWPYPPHTDQGKKARKWGEQTCAHLDVPVPETLEGVLAIMELVGVVRYDHDGEGWVPVLPLPLPEEKLPLTPQERAQEDKIRAERLDIDGGLQKILGGTDG